MVAEERISTQFCGLVLAQDDEEEGSFLSTQLVDEVRHMQFYARFQNEVIADPAAIGAHVARAREVLGEPFRKIFDEALVDAHDRLRLDPRDREAKVDFVTIYHMVIEGTLGITASHFLLDLLRDRGAARASPRATAGSPPTSSATSPTGPGSCARRSPPTRRWPRSSAARLRDLLPAVAESVSPPSEGAWDLLGVEDGALRAVRARRAHPAAEADRRRASGRLTGGGSQRRRASRRPDALVDPQHVEAAGAVGVPDLARARARTRAGTSRSRSAMKPFSTRGRVGAT